MMDLWSPYSNLVLIFVPFFLFLHIYTVLFPQSVAIDCLPVMKLCLKNVKRNEKKGEKHGKVGHQNSWESHTRKTLVLQIHQLNFEMKVSSFGSCLWATLSLSFLLIHYADIISLWNIIMNIWRACIYIFIYIHICHVYMTNNLNQVLTLKDFSWRENRNLITTLRENILSKYFVYVDIL